jgi:hypothetical protein
MTNFPWFLLARVDGKTKHCAHAKGMQFELPYGATIEVMISRINGLFASSIFPWVNNREMGVHPQRVDDAATKQIGGSE